MRSPARRHMSKWLLLALLRVKRYARSRRHRRAAVVAVVAVVAHFARALARMPVSFAPASPIIHRIDNFSACGFNRFSDVVKIANEINNNRSLIKLCSGLLAIRTTRRNRKLANNNRRWTEKAPHRRAPSRRVKKKPTNNKGNKNDFQ